MRSISKYQNTLKHFGKALSAFVMAMDTSPSELLYSEISKLKQEIEELKAEKVPSTDYHEAA